MRVFRGGDFVGERLGLLRAWGLYGLRFLVAVHLCIRFRSLGFGLLELTPLCVWVIGGGAADIIVDLIYFTLG